METFVKATPDAGQPKKDVKPKEIRGCLRVSRVLFPPEYQTPADTAHHIECPQQTRQSELEADAA